MKKSITNDFTFGQKTIRPQRDLTAYETIELLNETETNNRDSIIQALQKAYLAGFAQGYKQAKAEIKRQEK